MNIGKTASYILSAVLALSACACHTIEEWDDNPRGNFEALWTILDEHYCFFADKDVDWDEIGRQYRAEIDPDVGPDSIIRPLCQNAR